VIHQADGGREEEWAGRQQSLGIMFTNNIFICEKRTQTVCHLIVDHPLKTM